MSGREARHGALAGLDADDIAFLRERRVGHLATADAAGAPAVVPFCFALVEGEGGSAIVSPLDEKPKETPIMELRRVRNLLARPDVALVVDDYAEEWSRLRWVIVRGRGRLALPGEPGHAAGIAALRAKYPQYGAMAIDERPLVVVDPVSARSWRGGTAGEPRPRPGEAELAELIRGRRSVRAFRPEPVPRGVVERAIAAAGWAPSPHGRQPWRFAVVEAPERRAALAEAMAETWRAQLRLDGQDEATVARRLAMSRERLTTAPVLIVVCLYLADLDVYPDPERQAAETTMAIQSLGAAVQNLLLALYAAGIDGGWMCAPLFCPGVVRDTLGLGAELIPQALIPVGYAAKEPLRRPRRPPAELIVAWA